MSLCRFGANARLVSKFVVALFFAAAALSMWGCDGGEGVAGFNSVALLSISSSSLPAGKVGDPYTATLNGSGGAESGYVWSVIAGDLPTGLTLTPVGTPDATISGTPTISGVFQVTIRVQDARGESYSTQFTLTIAPATLVILTPNPLPDGDVNKNYSVAIAANLGTGQGYTWSIQAGGQLPPGLAIAPSGTPSTLISGIPSDTGSLPFTFTFTVLVVDSGGFSATQQYQLHINAALTISTYTVLPDGCFGNDYGNQVQPLPPGLPVPPSVVIDADGGTEQGYTWSTTPSVPIPGVTIDSTGIPTSPFKSTTFTGAPTVNGDFNFSVTVDDNGPNATTKAFSVKVHPAIVVTPGVLPEGTVGDPLPLGPPGVIEVPVDQPDQLFFSATGGPPGSTFTYAFAQAIPPVAGVNLAPDGKLSGTPTVAGTYIFDVVASTTFQQAAPPPPNPPYAPQVFKGIVQVTFVVVGKLDITTTKLLPLNQNTSFFQLISATGGTPGSYLWQIYAGSLPTGLQIIGSGYPSTNIQGTPINRGPYDFTVRVTDANGRYDDQNFQGVVDYPAGTIESFIDPKGDGLLAAGTLTNQHLNGCGLWSPEAITVDSAGNTYIADTTDHCIRKVDGVTGIISTIAGISRVAGFSGDGSAALNAQFSSPCGLCVDDDDTDGTPKALFIADRGNGRIRRIVFSTGIITTVAGLGNSTYQGELLTANATTRYLYNPCGLAIDKLGRVYIADRDNHRIRRLEWDAAANGGLGWYFIRIMAGSTAAGSWPGAQQDGATATPPTSGVGVLSSPYGVAVDQSADPTYMLIADTNNNYIRRVDFTGALDLPGNISRVAGNGPAGSTGTTGYSAAHENVAATSATLWTPRSVTIDSTNNDFYIADTYNRRIRKVKASDGKIVNMVGQTTAIASSGIEGDGSAASSTTATVADTTCIFFYRTGGVSYVYFTQVADLASPLKYSTYPRNAARRINLTTPPFILERVAGWGRGRVLYPFFSNNAHENGSSSFVQLPGFTNSSYGLTGHNRIQCKVIRDKAGYLFIADCGNHRVLRYNPTTNTLLNVAGSGLFGNPATVPAIPLSNCLNGPCDVAVRPISAEEDPVDQSATVIYIADFLNRCVRRVDLAPGGQLTIVAGNPNNVQPYANPGDGAPATLAEIGYPQSITFDQYNKLYIGTYGTLTVGHHRVRQVDMSSGTISTYVNGNGTVGNAGDNGQANSATVYYIQGMCCDANYLYIIDGQCHRVRKISLLNTFIEHFAGHPNTTGGGFVDNVPAGSSQAMFNWPEDVKIDNFGNVYIADTNNHRIRKVTASSMIVTTVGGVGSQGYTASQDGGQATSANLSSPTGIFITPDGGSLWVMDTNNQRLRRIVKP